MNNLSIAILSIVLLLASFWIFNHINPWAGVGATITIAVAAIFLMIKNLNKKD